jgi:hypothetical protein
MPITSTLLAQSIRSNIEDKWPSAWKPITQASQQLIEAYADGLGIALFNALSGLVFAPGSVSGGAAPPGGPVVGATLSYAPGSLSGSCELLPVFTPPNFSVEVDAGNGEKKTVTGSYTPWLQCFTQTLAQSLSQAWQQYILGWSLVGAVVVGGGTAAWVASTPPAPGPWLGGTITTPFPLDAPGFGASVYSWDLFAGEFVLAGELASVTIPIPASDPITTTLIATTEGEMLAKAIADGFSETVKETVSTVTVYDPTGSGGSGTALPGGVITPGVLAGAMLNLSA